MKKNRILWPIAWLILGILLGALSMFFWQTLRVESSMRGGADVVQKLLEDLKSREIKHRETASIQLAVLCQELDKEVSNIRYDAKASRSPLVRDHCIRVLGALAWNPLRTSRTKEELEKILTTDPDAKVRRSAAIALGELGGYASDAVPALLSATQNSEWGVRCSSVRSLGDIGVGTKECLEVLENLLRNDPYPMVRGAAAESLGKIGATDENTAVSLISGMSDESEDVRQKSAIAIGRLQLNETGIVNALREGLKWEESSDNVINPFWGLRDASAWALGQAGPKASAAIPDLETMLAKESDPEGSYAQYALDRIRGKTTETIPSPESSSWAPMGEFTRERRKE
jgi:HEAT repeat protein